MPAPAKIDARVTIKVNGVPLSTADAQHLVEVIVDSDYYLPTLFDFALYDDDLAYTDSDKFKVGSPVVISMDATLDSGMGSVKNDLVDGLITSLEPMLTKDSRCLLHVRGYDRGYKLMSGEKTRVFGGGTKNSITEGDIVSSVAGEAGLSAKVDSSYSAIQGAYVMQYAQTNWDFLWSRAQRLGYQIYVDGTALTVSKANVARDNKGGITLEWGKSLETFEPRVSIVGQADKAVATSWDIEKKAAVVSEVTSGTLSTNLNGQAGLSAKSLSSNYANTAQYFLQEPGLDDSTAKKIADARLSALESGVLQASGSMPCGHPKLLAGGKVTIKNIGTKFSGDYFVTHACHTYSEGGYRVDFEVSGTVPHTLAGLLDAAPKDHGRRLVDGVVVGVVTNNNDPDKLGRVKVKFPWLPKNNGAEIESFWARLATPGGGKERGMLYMPEIDDEVLVVFEHGDINMPYIIGGLWNKKDTPPDGLSPELVASGKVNQRVIRSRSGHLILLDDKEGEEQIVIQDKSKKNSIVINTKENAMTLSCQKDFTIEAGGNFTVKAKGDVLFDAPGKFDIKSIKSFSVTALQEALLKAASTQQLALKASGAELSGLMVNVKANTNVSVSGSAMAEIKGGLVKIN